MTARLPPLNSLRAFTVAARHLNFRHAAVELHVTPAAISHQVKGLENYLGISLFRRTPRGLVLTAEGERCLPYFDKAFNDLHAGVAELRRQTATANLRVGVPLSLATRWLVPRLQRFIAACPGVEVQIVASMQAVDTPSSTQDDALVLNNAGAEDVDLAIRFGTGQLAGFACHRLFDVEITPLCSPQLLRGPHPLRRPQDLERQTLLHDDSALYAEQPPYWDLCLGGLGILDLDCSDSVHFSQSGLALDAAVNNMGVVATVTKLAEDDLAAGRLVRPFDVSVPLPSAYYLAHRIERADEPLIVAFRRWLLAEREFYTDAAI